MARWDAISSGRWARLSKAASPLSALSLSVLSIASKPVIALSARSRSVASSASTFSTSDFSVEGPALWADHRQDIRDLRGALASVPQPPRQRRRNFFHVVMFFSGRSIRRCCVAPLEKR
jgi:hypothetical protein